jgi:ATP-binding cassette subfamily B protein
MRKHSWLNNMSYCLHDLWLYNKKAIFALVIEIITNLTSAILAVLLTYFVVQALTVSTTAASYISLISILSAATFVSTALQIWSTTYYNWESTFARCFTSWLRMNTKILRTDYQNVEPRDKRSALMKGFQALDSNWVGIEAMMKQAPLLVIGLLGMITYAVITALYVPWVLLVMAFMLISSILWTAWGNAYIQRTRDRSEKDYTRAYALNKDATALQNAKDVRAYQMKPWFDSAYEVLSKRYFNLQVKTNLHLFAGEVSNNLFHFIRDFVAYMLLLPQVINGTISLSTFSFLVGIVAGFSAWVNSFVTARNKAQFESPLVTDYRNALEMKDVFNHDKGLDVNSLQRPLKISLNHVSFRYPGSDKDVLHDINLDIKPGEKIAIVGNNGAGKTTLIKLLCGLYQTTEGTITIDDHDIKEFNIDDYMSLISALFQDVHPLAFTVKMNVTCCLDKDADEKKFQESIERAGLAERVAELPQKENTYISQEFNLDGIQLSGGETQKLLLARALYKNAPLLVLDEPTAALDPLSEEAMYKEYLNFTKGNTSIFISHRLASTRFCDRIVYLANGTISAIGTHEELLEKSKDYREMFDLQAKYYREEKGGEDNGQAKVGSSL